MRIAAGVSRLYWRVACPFSSPRYGRDSGIELSGYRNHQLFLGAPETRVGFLSRFLMRCTGLGNIFEAHAASDRLPCHEYIKNDAESYGLDDMIGLADEDIYFICCEQYMNRDTVGWNET